MQEIEEEGDEEGVAGEEEFEYYHAGHLKIAKKKGAEERYFVLSAESFSYWESEDACVNGAEPRGFMALDDISRLEEVGVGFTVHLESVEKPLNIEALNDEELQVWLDTFRSVIGERLGDNFVARPPAEVAEEEEEEDEERPEELVVAEAVAGGAAERGPTASSARAEEQIVEAHHHSTTERVVVVSSQVSERVFREVDEEPLGAAKDPRQSTWGQKVTSLALALKRKKRGYYWSTHWECEGCGETQKSNVECFFRSPTPQEHPIDLCEQCYAQVVLPSPGGPEAVITGLVQISAAGEPKKKKKPPAPQTMLVVLEGSASAGRLAFHKTIEDYGKNRPPAKEQSLSNITRCIITAEHSLLLFTQQEELELRPLIVEAKWRAEALRWGLSLEFALAELGRETGVIEWCDELAQDAATMRKAFHSSVRISIAAAAVAVADQEEQRLSSEAEPGLEATEANASAESNPTGGAAEAIEDPQAAAPLAAADGVSAGDGIEVEMPAEQESEERQGGGEGQELGAAAAAGAGAAAEATREPTAHSDEAEVAEESRQEQEAVAGASSAAGGGGAICEGPLKMGKKGDDSAAADSVWGALYPDRLCLSVSQGGPPTTTILLDEVMELDFLFSSFDLTHTGGIVSFEVPPESSVDADGWCEAFAPLFEDGDEGHNNDEGYETVAPAEPVSGGAAAFASGEAFGRASLAPMEKKIQEIFRLCSDRSTGIVSKSSTFAGCRSSALLADVFGIEGDVEGGIGAIESALVEVGIAVRLDTAIHYEDFRRFWLAWAEKRDLNGCGGCGGKDIGASSQSTPRAGSVSAVGSTAVPLSVRSSPETPRPPFKFYSPKPRALDEKVMSRLTAMPKRYQEALEKPKSSAGQRGLVLPTNAGNTTMLQTLHGTGSAVTFRKCEAPGSITQQGLATKINERDPRPFGRSGELPDKVTGTLRSLGKSGGGTNTDAPWAKITSGGAVSARIQLTPSQQQRSARQSGQSGGLRSSSGARSQASAPLRRSSAATPWPPDTARSSIAPPGAEAPRPRSALAASSLPMSCLKRTPSAPAYKITDGTNGRSLVDARRASTTVKITDQSRAGHRQVAKNTHAGGLDKLRPLGGR